MTSTASRDPVRAATAGDISRIAEILVFGKRVAYRDIFKDDIGSFVGLQVGALIDAYRATPSPLDRVLVYDDGIVKGMLRWDDGANGDQAELCELYVEPFFKGQGVGRRLMRRFLSGAVKRGMRDATLWVVSSNAPARRFYEACGFAPTGEQRPVEGTAVMETRYRRTL